MEGNGDLSWLSGRVGRAAYQLPSGDASVGSSSFAQLVSDAGAGIVCEPTQVARMKHARAASSPGGATHVIALIGWPTGRHHSLIKAAEARLAVEEGASEVWVAVDVAELAGTSGSTQEHAAAVNAIYADIIAVSQVIEEPTRFGVTIPASVGARRLQELADAAGKVGVDLVAVSVDKPGALELPAVTCGLAVHGALATLDEAADALLAGADRVFPAGA